MPANQNFAKRTGECMKDVKPEHGKACESLDDYFKHRATMKATLKSSSFLVNYLPTEKPSGIFSSASCEARNRPQSAVSSSRRVGFQ